MGKVNQCGEYLRYLREKEEWGLREFARELGCSHAYLAKCEQNSYALSGRYLEEICDRIPLKDARKLVRLWIADRKTSARAACKRRIAEYDTLEEELMRSL